MCHVLIIEDEAVLALDLQGLLIDQGATSFDIAETQAEAIAFARAHRPDVITSDVRLREGTGPLAVEAIVAEHGALPVIFITGSPEECIPCDLNAVILVKPLHEPMLASVFQNLAPV